MKSLHRGSPEKSCSCSSCVFKSDSDRSSIRRAIDRGSRIDKLYLGKYVPLRERKLIERLIKTRAVYDDLRKQILSDSSISLNKVNLEQRDETSPKDKKFKANKSSDILAIVNLVDRGDIRSSDNLNDCCNCCDCGSNNSSNGTNKIPLRYNEGIPGQRYAHNHVYPPVKKSLSKLMVDSKEKLKQVSRFNKNVRFRTKRVRSEPCTCSYKFSGLLKQASRTNQQRINQKRTQQPRLTVELERTQPEMLGPQRSKVQKAIRRSIQELKHSRTCLCDNIQNIAKNSATKLKKSATKLKDELKIASKRSVQELKHVKHQIQEKIISTNQKTISLLSFNEENVDKNAFKIMKDSLTKFREKMQQQRDRKSWKCEHECNPDACVPEKCFQIIKRRKILGNLEKREISVKVGEPVGSTDIGINVKENGDHTKLDKEHYKNKKVNQKKVSAISGVNFDLKKSKSQFRTKSGVNKTTDKIGSLCICEKEYQVSKIKPDKKMKQSSKIISQSITSRDISKISTNESKTDEIARNIRRPSNMFSTVDNQKTVKDNQASKHPLKQCICALKLKTKKTKMHFTKTSKETTTQQILPPYECEPNICIPDQCDPLNCERIKKNRNSKTRFVSTNKHLQSKSVSTKIPTSTSSVTSRKVQPKTKSKRILLSTGPAGVRVTNNYEPQKQVVRIGSTFSLNIEFSKEKPSLKHFNNNNNKDDARSIENKSKSTKRNKTQGYAKKYIRHKYSQVSNSTRRSRSSFKKYNLRRCLCTLKFAELEKKRKNQLMSKSTLTPYSSFDHTQIAEKQLGEIAPGICIPGKCDPNQCDMLLSAMHRKRLKSRTTKSNTKNRKTRPTSSSTSHSVSVSKTKKVQSAFMAPEKEMNNYVPKKSLSLSQFPNKTHKYNSQHRKAVKIGSTFSFSVEFYKEKQDNVAPNFATRYDRQIIPIINKSKSSKPISKNCHTQSTQLNHRLKQIKEDQRKKSQVRAATNRCVCVLKLQKLAINQKKNKVHDKGTKTAPFEIKSNSYVSIISQKTMTKTPYEYIQNLDPNECEPNFCIPGDCYPVACLEVIKRRNRRLITKDEGIATKPIKVRSSFSSMKKSTQSTKNAITQSKVLKKRSIKQTALPSKVPPVINFSEKPHDVNNEQTRQAVNIGSKFSFDIEFYKELPREELQRIQKQLKTKRDGYQKSSRNIEDNHVKVSVKRQLSQVAVKSKHKSKEADLLKRCFCTLNLKKYRQHSENKDISWINLRRSIKPVDVYAVSKIITGNCIYPSKPTTREYMSSKDNENIIIQNRKLKHLYSVVNRSKNNFSYRSFSQIDFSKHMRYDLKMKQSKENRKSSSFLKIFNDNNSCSKIDVKKKISETSIHNIIQKSQIKINGEHPFSKCFHAMNIQLLCQKKATIMKTKPCLYEFSICMPYARDLDKRPKLLKKELLKKRATLSSNSIISKSTSSYTLSSTPYEHNSIKLHTCEAKEIKLPSKSEYMLVPETYINEIQYRSNHGVEPKKCFKNKSEKQKRDESSQTILTAIDLKREKKSKPIYKSNRKQKLQQTFKNIKTLDKESQLMDTTINRKLSKTQLLMNFFRMFKLKKQYKISTKPAKCQFVCTLPKNDVSDLSTSDSTLSIKSVKREIFDMKLYEYEPVVCIPSRCDFFQLLEAGKNKKQNLKNKDTSLKCSNMLTSIKTEQHYDRGVHRKKLKSQNRSYYLESTRILDASRKVLSVKSGHEVEHIYSSSNYNTQIFKQNSFLLKEYCDKSVNTRTWRSYANKAYGDVAHIKNNKNNNLIQNTELFRDSTIDLQQNFKSTMIKSLTNRCFYVANMHQQVKFNTELQKTAYNVYSLSKTQKSPYFLKKSNKELENINSNKRATVISPIKKIESCDPDECERMMNYRKKIDTTKLPDSTNNKMKSVPSNIKTIKRIRTEFKKQNINKQHFRRISSMSKKQNQEKDSSEQAVRLGSNFSFDIEFSKNTTMDDTAKKESFIKTNNQNTQDKAISKITPAQKTSVCDKGSTNVTKKMSKASAVEHMLHRCFCTLALNKCKLKKEGTTMTFQSFGGSGEKQTPDLKNVSVMTSNKTVPYKLEPYECEPNFCIPGQCDPLVCKKRIKKRLQEQSSSTASISKTKSASSLTPTYQTKNKKTRVKSEPNKKEKWVSQKSYKKSITPGKSINKSNNQSNRQAVRIGSSFNFDIEFFKDKSPDTTVKISKLPKSQDKSAPRNYFIRESRAPTYSHKESRYSKQMQNIDSQTISKTVRSTMTGGMKPFLKKCFCTLKLHKFENKTKNDDVKLPEIVRNTITEGTNTKEKMIFAQKGGESYRNQSTTIKNSAFSAKYLEPYECEPGTCIPGECNPYECAERIKLREFKMACKSCCTDKVDNYTKFTSAGIDSKAKKSQALSIGTKKRRQRHSEPKRTELDYQPERQAIRVGSSFSFDIEFIKQKTSAKPLQFSKDENFFIENKCCPGSTIKRKTHDMSSGKEGINYCHRHSQITNPLTASKGSGVEPLLKRCFCTLKLQKLGKQFNQEPARMETKKPSLKSTYTETERKTKKINKYPEIKSIKTHLEPYECEPGVCIPGFCDPYECEKLIKNRHMKESGTLTDRANLKSVSNLTSYNRANKSIITQKQTQKKNYNHKTCKTSSIKEKLNTTQTADKNVERQALRVGSSFSFNIEFYKNQTPKQTRSLPSPQNVKCKNLANNGTKTEKCRKMKSSQVKRSKTSYCRGLQAMPINTESRGSAMPTNLKRCFCTLALQKFSGIPIPDNQSNNVPKQKNDKFTPVEVKTQTKLKLLNYNCKPEIYRATGNDLEKTKKRATMMNNPKYNKTLIEKPKNISIEPHIQNKPNNVLIKPCIQNKPKCASNKSAIQNKVARRDETKQAVKIGTNFGFSIDIYKQARPREISVNKKPNANQYNACKETKITHDDEATGNIYDVNNCGIQSPLSKTKDKASIARNILKKCFCTAEFHNNSSLPSTIRPTIVNNVEYNTIFKPQQYHVYYQSQGPMKKNCTEKCVCTICDRNTTKPTASVGETKTKNKYLKIDLETNNFEEKHHLNFNTPKKPVNAMETILPYIPGKFKKKVSKTILVQDGKVKHSKLLKFELMCIHSTEYNSGLDLNKKRNPNMLNETLIKKSKFNPLNDIVCLCKMMFSKKKKTPMDKKLPRGNIKPICMNIEAKCKSIMKLDKLKMSKSERRPVSKNKNVPKKTKSLKIPKTPNLIECSAKRYQNNNFRNKCTRFQQGDTKENNTRTGLKFQITGDSNEYKKYNKPHYQTTFCNEVPEFNKNRCDLSKTVKFEDMNIQKNNCGPRKKNKKVAKSKKACPCSDKDSYFSEKYKQNKISGYCKDSKVNQRIKKGRKNICECSAIVKDPRKAKASVKKVKHEDCECQKIAKAKKQKKMCRCYSSVCMCEKLMTFEKKKKKILEVFFNRQSLRAKKKRDRQIQKEKKRKQKAKKSRREFLLRQRRYKIEDAIRFHKRRDLERYLEKRIKAKDTPDYLVAPKSVLDIAKLSCTVLEDIARSTCRAFRDPVHATRCFGATIKEPSRVGHIMKKAIINCGLPKTFKRIIRRFQKISSVRKIKAFLERYSLTNHILPIGIHVKACVKEEKID